MPHEHRLHVPFAAQRISDLAEREMAMAMERERRAQSELLWPSTLSAIWWMALLLISGHSM